MMGTLVVKRLKRTSFWRGATKLAILIVSYRTHKGVTALKFSSHLDQVCRSQWVKCAKIMQKIDISELHQKCLFGTVSYFFQILFSDDDFYTIYVIEKGPFSLKMLSCLDNICETQMVKSTRKLIVLLPGKSLGIQDFLKSSCVLNHIEANLLTLMKSNFSFALYIFSQLCLEIYCQWVLKSIILLLSGAINSCIEST